MEKPPSWDIDVNSLSHKSLVQFLIDLDETSHPELVEKLQREFINRLNARGVYDTREIIRRLSFAVPRDEIFNKMARKWSRVLGVTPTEFKRIANLR